MLSAPHMDPLGALAPLEDGTACNLSGTQVEFDRAGTRLRQGREFRPPPIPNLTSGLLISLFSPSSLRLGFVFEWEGAIASFAWSNTGWLVSHFEPHREFLLFLAPLQALGAAEVLLWAGHQGVKSQPSFFCSASL